MFGKNAGNFQLLCSSVSTLGRLKTREWKTQDGRKVTENPKPTRITELKKTYDACFRSLEAQNYQFGTSPLMSLCYTVYNNNNTNNDISSVCVTNKPMSITPHITFLVVIQLLVSRNERDNRLGWTAFTGSLV